MVYDTPRDLHISIHALREEGDPSWQKVSSRRLDFSPPPPRGWGLRAASPRRVRYDFYPRPPRGGRPITLLQSAVDGVFLSTPSARRATSCVHPLQRHIRISIHALREEGDIV